MADPEKRPVTEKPEPEEIDRAKHSCSRRDGWSLFAAATCDGCAMEYLNRDGDIIDLARACTGLLHPIGMDRPERSGILYEGTPSEEQRERAHRLWRELHGSKTEKVIDP